jgi:hypothetical protein
MASTQPLGFMCPDGGRYGYCDLEEFPYGGYLGVTSDSSIDWCLALEPGVLTRWEVRRWARAAYQAGVRYIGGCCGFEPYHIRAIAEELAPERGRLPEGSDKSDYDLATMKKICESYSGKAVWFEQYITRNKIVVKDVETQYGMRKCCPDFWLKMEPATGRPRSAALSSVNDPEIKMDG